MATSGALDVRVRERGAADDRWRGGGVGVVEDEDEVEGRVGLKPEVDVPLEEVVLEWRGLREEERTFA